MAFRDRVLNVNNPLFQSDEASSERIRESIYKLWFSVQQYVRHLDPSASPSDYSEQVARLAECRLNGSGETAAIDGAVRQTFRDVAYNARRAGLRRQVKFVHPDPPELESIPDPNGDRFAAALADQSHREWQIEEIRRHLDPEMMKVIEQLYGFHSEQWTIDNLSKRMGINKNTLEQRLSRAFAKLRSQLPFAE
jgi:hypothetical protein